MTFSSRVDYTGCVSATTSTDSVRQNAAAESALERAEASATAKGAVELAPSRAQALVWLATATLTGAIVMAMELTAFRLYAPYFGNSIYVWGSMISVVMLALAVGYSLGGWIADRAATDRALYFVVLGTGLYQLGVVFALQTVLAKFWTWGDFAGPVAATAIIFVLPMTGLAMTSPFVIRLLARAHHVGITAGSVFAVSTAGSIAGVLATSFWLVPRFGTTRTLQILCALSLLIGAAGLMIRRRAAVLLALPAVLLAFSHASRPAPPIIWNEESAYNRIFVYEADGLRWLVLNNNRFFQTIEKIGSANSGFYLDAFALGPLTVPAKNLLVLGMGAGQSIDVTRAVKPEIEVDAVEIDPAVVNVAERFFALPKSDPHVHVHIADARPWLEAQGRKWDLVHVDLFQGGPYVPFYLTTVEFFQLVRSRMAPNGMLMLNVLDKGEKRELLNSIAATLQQVFPSVQCLPSRAGNYILLAFPEKRPLAETMSQLKQGAGPDWVRELAQKAAAGIEELEPRSGTTIFTDDKAPVEEMTRRMLAESRQ